MDSYILVFPNGYCLSTCAIRDRLWVNGSDEAITFFQAVALRCDVSLHARVERHASIASNICMAVPDCI